MPEVSATYVIEVTLKGDDGSEELEDTVDELRIALEDEFSVSDPGVEITGWTVSVTS
jgi:hypothetical protein